METRLKRDCTRGAASKRNKGITTRRFCRDTTRPLVARNWIVCNCRFGAKKKKKKKKEGNVFITRCRGCPLPSTSRVFVPVDDWKFWKLASFGVTNCNFKNLPSSVEKKHSCFSLYEFFERIGQMHLRMSFFFFLSRKKTCLLSYFHVNYNSWIWIEFFFKDFLWDPSIFITYV